MCRESGAVSYLGFNVQSKLAWRLILLPPEYREYRGLLPCLTRIRCFLKILSCQAKLIVDINHSDDLW